MKRLALLTLMLWLTVSRSAEAALIEDICTEGVLSDIGAFYKLDEFALRMQGGKLITGDCKVWPNNAKRILSAFIYNDSDDFRKTLLVTAYDTAREKIVASFREPAEYSSEDWASRPGSVFVDLAPYRLAPGITAFGIRKELDWYPCATNGGRGPELQLFIVQGTRLKPVLPWIAMSDYYRESTDCFDSQRGQEIVTALTISIEKTRTKGFYDLRIAATQEEIEAGKPHRTRRFSYVVKFNGQQYDMSGFLRTYAKWDEEWIRR